jgi:glycosyltransferase involved in cell wall biosynthesis
MIALGCDMSGVSFIVTIFNKRLYLPAVLAGLAEQDGLAEAEFLFIDDGSTDGSLAYLESALAEPALAEIAGRARILTQPNRGPAHATNRGIALAAKRWTKLVDGDDRLLGGASASLVAAAEAAGAGVALGELIPYELDGPPPPRPVASGAPLRIADPLMTLARRMTFNPSAVLIETELARRVGGCDERVFVQDYSLMLRAAARADFIQVPWPVAALPSGTESRISADSAQILHDLNAANFWYLADHPETGRAVQRLMARRAAVRAWHWVRRHHGGGFASREFGRFLASYGPILDPRARIAQSCTSFRARAAIRIPA